MNWTLAAAAPALVGLVFLATGRIHPAILAYHVWCAVLIVRFRSRIRPLLRWERSTLPWILGTTTLVAAFLSAAPLVQDPSPYRNLYRMTLFPSGEPGFLFPLFSAYTLLIHAPVEEVYWRAVVTDPHHGKSTTVLIGNALFFGLLHAVPLTMILGPLGILLSLPTASAGAVWAFVTIRTRSLWPALVSHWGADALILAGMWFFFIR